MRARERECTADHNYSSQHSWQFAHNELTKNGRFTNHMSGTCLDALHGATILAALLSCMPADRLFDVLLLPPSRRFAQVTSDANPSGWPDLSQAAFKQYGRPKQLPKMWA
jgi:hypothetical protein